MALKANAHKHIINISHGRPCKKLNPNKHRLIFSVISRVTADPHFPVGISVRRSLCGPVLIVFVQQFESGAEFDFFYGGRADERFSLHWA